MANDVLTRQFVVVVATLLVALWSLRTTRRMLLPTSHLLAGRYPEARIAADKLAASWLSAAFYGLRAAAIYTAASAEHLAGRLEASLEVLGRLQLARLDDNHRYAARSLEAANLVLIDRDHARALDAITEARALQDSPEDALFAAHALVSLGRNAEADALFERAGAAPGGPKVRFGNGLAFDTGQIKTAMFHYLRGAYLARTAREDKGRQDFAVAAESRVPSVYAKRARQALDGRAPVPSQIDDPSSSLSPLELSTLIADLPPSRRS